MIHDFQATLDVPEDEEANGTGVLVLGDHSEDGGDDHTSEKLRNTFLDPHPSGQQSLVLLSNGEQVPIGEAEDRAPLGAGEDNPDYFESTSSSRSAEQQLQGNVEQQKEDNRFFIDHTNPYYMD
ncbi:unnamed protein product [Amoebophrya sp. A25]|nr:unnamed protein product [Amoebophrya sp. A25]|eukprot:GSA25T00022802001.1